MTVCKRLDLLFQQNNGIVKIAQVLESGIAKSTIYAYTRQRGVEQAEHGVYVLPFGIKNTAIHIHQIGRIFNE